jgi:hypothetical protein
MHTNLLICFYCYLHSCISLLTLSRHNGHICPLSIFCNGYLFSLLDYFLFSQTRPRSKTVSGCLHSSTIYDLSLSFDFDLFVAKSNFYFTLFFPRKWKITRSRFSLRPNFDSLPWLPEHESQSNFLCQVSNMTSDSNGGVISSDGILSMKFLYKRWLSSIIPLFLILWTPQLLVQGRTNDEITGVNELCSDVHNSSSISDNQTLAQ